MLGHVYSPRQFNDKTVYSLLNCKTDYRLCNCWTVYSPRQFNDKSIKSIFPKLWNTPSWGDFWWASPCLWWKRVECHSGRIYWVSVLNLACKSHCSTVLPLGSDCWRESWLAAALCGGKTMVCKQIGKIFPGGAEYSEGNKGEGCFGARLA